MKTQTPSNEALSSVSKTEYSLKPTHSFVWITVDNISVYLRRHDDNVSVDLYPVGQENSDSLAGTYLSFDESRVEE